MIDVLWSNELVLHKDCGWSGFATKNVEGKQDQIGPIAFREVSHGADQPGAWLTELSPAFGFGVVSQNSAFGGPPSFFKRAKGTEGARVCRGSDQDALSPGRSKVLTDGF